MLYRVRQWLGGLALAAWALLACACAARSAPTPASATAQEHQPKVDPRAVIHDLSAYGSAACAIRADHRVWCWGDVDGWVAGEDVMQTQPVLIDLLPEATRVFMGPAGICVAGREGGLHCLGRFWLARRPYEMSDFGSYDERQSVQAGQALEQAPEAVAIGTDHACALVSGTPWCWGSPLTSGTLPWWRGKLPEAALDTESASGGEERFAPHPIAGVPALVSIHVDRFRSCGLDRAHQIWCWGFENGEMGGFANLAAPQRVDTAGTAGELGEIAVGADGVYQVRDSAVIRALPAKEPAVHFDFGRPVTSVRAVDADARVARFYGIDESGRVRHTDGEAAAEPLPMLRHVVRLAGGRGAANPREDGDQEPSMGLMCALTASHRVFCWHSQQVPDSETPFPEDLDVLAARQRLGWISLPPQEDEAPRKASDSAPLVARAQPVPGDHSIRALAIGKTQACAARADGRLFCWHPGNPDGAQQITEEAIVDIAGWDSYFAAVTAGGKVLSWVTPLERAFAPRLKSPPWLHDAARIVFSTTFGFCTLHTDGSVQCFRPSFTTLLDQPSVVPSRRTLPIEDAIALAPTKPGICALDTNERLRCWHWQYGEVTYEVPPSSRDIVLDERGHTRRLDNPGAIAVLDGQGKVWRAALHERALALAETQQAPWKQLVHGKHHSCGLTERGTLLCWGTNDFGELGRGTVTDREDEPAAVIGLPPLERFVLTDAQTCASSGAEVWCWGLARPQGAVLPRRVSIDAPIASFAFNGNNGAAIDEDGKLWMWGAKNQALGFSKIHFTPRLMPTDEPMEQLLLGASMPCGLTRSQRVLCWFGNTGENPGGPTEVSLPGNASRLAVGKSFACAIVNARTFCWGMRYSSKHKASFRTQVMEIPGIRNPVSLTVGQAPVACALTKQGRVGCWNMSPPGAPPATASGEPFRPSPVRWLQGIDRRDRIDDIELWGIYDSLRLHSGERHVALSSSLFSCYRAPCPAVKEVRLCQKTPSSLKLPRCKAPPTATERRAARRRPRRRNAPPEPVKVSEWRTVNERRVRSIRHDCKPRKDIGYQCEVARLEDTLPAAIVTEGGKLDKSWCALLEDRHIYCLGSNHDGALGNGHALEHDTPVRVGLP